MGSDKYYEASDTAEKKFQSTLPAWGATDEEAARRRLERISIHAPRMGSDYLHH